MFEPEVNAALEQLTAQLADGTTQTITEQVRVRNDKYVPGS